MEVDQLAAAIQRELSKYGDEVSDVVDKAVEKVAKDTASEIRGNASVTFDGTGAYARSWAQKKQGKIRVVYSKAPHYRLSHLLENGHAKVNGGRVPGRPHISPAADKAAKELPRLIERGLKGDS